MTPFNHQKKRKHIGDSFSIHLFLAVTILLFSIMGLPTYSWADTWYAKQDGVKVTAEKSSTSALIETLNLGDAVTVVNGEGRVVKVKTTKGKSGWVFKFRLSEEKPSSGGGLGLSGLMGRNTIAARESRAGGSIRGLKETTEQYAKDKQISQKHRDAVDRMEAFNVATDDLMEFKKSGRLGEFSGDVK